ncbi:DUF2059 domain-containing protein [Novosphingobium sp. BL-8A]|uniref:DUF2059 domain-containing protein n=1 Tax=Novosphingobium sp. BL-8A TaxID=3127639 RepID=UPI0037576505
MRPVFVAAAALLVTSAPAMAAEPAATSTQMAAPASVPDPARLAAAQRTVDAVFPSGTYARMMHGSMDKMMDTMMDSVMRIPLKDLAGMGGVDTSKLSSGSLHEIMEIYDPAFKQRLTVTNHTMMDNMVGIMTEAEPGIRDGLAHAYANKYTVAQLGELNAFFATPTGKTYAADSYLIMMSPEVMAKMQDFVPKLMKQMPAIMEKVKTATAGLPAPRKYDDLSPADKTRLAKLLGISEGELDKREEAKAAKSK